MLDKKSQVQANHLAETLMSDLPTIDKSFSSLRKIGVSVRTFTDIRINSFLGWSKISGQPYIGVNSIATFPRRRYLVLKEFSYLLFVEKWTPFNNYHRHSDKSILHSNLTRCNTRPRKHHYIHNFIHRKKINQLRNKAKKDNEIIENAVSQILVSPHNIKAAKTYATNKSQFYKRLDEKTGLPNHEAIKRYKKLLVLHTHNKKPQQKSMFGAKKVG